ncbi:putative GTP-binding protein 6 isoform X3 [Macaca fascicularis]|uniref:putative GTP-binding protein 6 isoform X3 n=1 Tax=Macaca fascicularis TaxID=9541 RepID=UPI003D15833B
MVFLYGCFPKCRVAGGGGHSAGAHAGRLVRGADNGRIHQITGQEARLRQRKLPTPDRKNWKPPGAWRCLTASQSSCTFSGATPARRKPGFRWPWRRSRCTAPGEVPSVWDTRQSQCLSYTQSGGPSTSPSLPPGGPSSVPPSSSPRPLLGGRRRPQRARQSRSHARSNLKRDVAHLHRGAGSRYIMGSGESFMQVQQRLLREKEAKIRKALDRLRKKRQLLRQQRTRREFPVVSVVGYTNCGKTTLIKALTGDAAIRPRDQLFATLDVTAHAGALPSRMTVLYVDSIGFLSQLPHGLIESFSATLEDVAHSDLIVHVRDVSHPEVELQKRSVLSTLHSLQLPAPLLDSMVEVHNKVDLVPGYRPTEPNAVPVSALLGHGLQELKAELDAAVLKATGRQILTLRVRLAGAQLSWLYKEATVQDVDVIPEDGAADVTVIISDSAYGKFRKLFPG